MDTEKIQQEAEAMYAQFVSHPPHRASFIGGVHAGAMWAWHECRADLAAARAEIERLRAAMEAVRKATEIIVCMPYTAKYRILAALDATPAPPPAPAWTSERPTVPGMYWTYNDISEEVFPVILVEHEPLPNGGWNHHKLPLSDWGWSHNQFVGPITPPPAPCPASEATGQGPE